MGEPDRREVVGAQQAEGAEHVLMLERAIRIDAHQRPDKEIDDPARLDVGRVERLLDLPLDVEAAGDPRQNRVRLAPPVRHRLEQGGDEAQRRAAPEIGEPKHVEQHEPAARVPDLPAQLPDQVGLAYARRADEGAAERAAAGIARPAVQLLYKSRHDGVVRSACRLNIEPDAIESAHPVEIDPAQGVEGLVHDWIQRRWKGSPAGL